MKLFYKKSFLIMLAIFFILLVVKFSGLIINTTNSIPVGIYIKTKDELKLNSYVAICLDGESAKIAKERGYLSAGFCKGNTELILKKISGVPGNQIKISEEGVMVENVLVNNSKPLIKDVMGRSLPALQISRRLETNEYIAMANNLYSYDSRYIGVVNKKQIVSVIVPIFLYEDIKK